MNISKKGLDLIKKWEGCPMKNGVCVAYQDCVGVWTIGWGMIDSDYSVTGVHVKKGVTISKEKADALFEKLIKAKYCPKVEKYMDKYNFNQNQYDALVSFAYNIGNIDGLTQNGERSIEEISEKITAYCKAGGKTVKGLLDRRKDEKKLFDTVIINKKKKYTGTLPVLPDYSFGVSRKYYQIGDGLNQLKRYKTQIKRLKASLNWALDIHLDTTKGYYDHDTESAVFKLQKKAGIPQNGKYGALCLGYIKSLRK